MQKREKAIDAKHTKILGLLSDLYPNANCALQHRNAFELLVSTILSAQCTDARVNQVTPALFEKYPSPEKMAEANIEDIETLIRTTGFFRSKAKALLQMSRSLIEKCNGVVPSSMDELLTLRGVGRKTANVVLGNAFQKNVGVVVDTHVGRISQRLGLTKHKDPVKIEKDLMKLVPVEKWTSISHEMILHGRAICKAQRPRCEICPLKDLCPTSKSYLKQFSKKSPSYQPKM